SVVRGRLVVGLRRSLVVVVVVGVVGASTARAQVSLGVAVTAEQRAGVEELARRAGGAAADARGAEAAVGRAIWELSPDGRAAGWRRGAGAAGLGSVGGRARG